MKTISVNGVTVSLFYTVIDAYLSCTVHVPSEGTKSLLQSISNLFA